jgi:hypothetical protein
MSAPLLSSRLSTAEFYVAIFTMKAVRSKEFSPNSPGRKKGGGMEVGGANRG